MIDRRTFLAHGAALWGAMASGRIPVSYRRFRGRRAGRADLILRRALVFDGSGAPPHHADVAVQGETILEVGPNLVGYGGTEVDLAGLALAPGFIDVHSHTDLVLLVNPRAESKIRQGVTTEVVGQDGGSIGPWTDEQWEQTRDGYRARYDADIDFRDLDGFFRRLERDAASVNLASMVGAGTVRRYVIGDGDRPADAAELRRMVSLVEDALRAGACGLSTGLEYIPGAFATLDELVALATPLRATGLPYSTHMRNEDDQLLAAIEEALNVGRLGGVPVQIAHLKAQGQRNWWKADSALDLLQRARTDGIDVMFDRYPYVAYSTGLGSLFPVWSRDGGTEAFLARLGDEEQRAVIERDVRAKVQKLGSWNAVQITSTRSDALAWARGRRLGELAAERGEEPYRLLERIIIDDRNGAGMVGFGMSEENTAKFLRHPLGMICSDAGARATYGALSSGTPHPRAYGTFPRVLGFYSRERELMPLETAIHKMTAMPATRLQLHGRGLVAAGAYADLVAFDPSTVVDNATFEHPHQYPTGVTHVWVNGTFVIRDGEHTGARPGRVLRVRV